ncbi:hypothetical protein [Catellatospora sp. NPDC049609]|uniref:hypothetical protein n=1 Tax=Catellatospora sp. NPDC049609 TaxID=3155505 RepID=UPI0034483A1F
MTDGPAGPTAPPPDLVPATVLRLDRPELDATARLVVRGAVDPRLREHRRTGAASPLAYLYERPDPDAPEADLTLSVGHYDEANLVWVFSGEVDGIIGLTQPTASAGDPPAARRGETA